MVNTNTFLEANWHARNKCIGHNQQWYQSKSGKPLRKRLQQEFIQRQLRREKEEKIGRCMRQITRDCKDMLRKKLEEIEVFNSSNPQDKYKKPKCFYCKQTGHDKNMVLCFKCKEYEHIADRCLSKEEQSKVSLKYLESIHFKTDGILKGTDHGTWDDFWYLSNTSDKHLCSNLNAFCNIKENFLVKELEEQKKFLFTYGMGEVIIKNDCQAYLIPGV
ncbi:ARID DNA-binding domain-containing protein [Tanacetum coccineum]